MAKSTEQVRKEILERAKETMDKYKNLPKEEVKQPKKQVEELSEEEERLRLVKRLSRPDLSDKEFADIKEKLDSKKKVKAEEVLKKYKE